MPSGAPPAHEVLLLMGKRSLAVAECLFRQVPPRHPWTLCRLGHGSWAMGLNGKVSEVSFYPGEKGKKTSTVVLEAWCGNLLFSIGGCCLSTKNRARLSRESAKKLSVRLSRHSPSLFRTTKSLSFTNCWRHHRPCEFCLRCTKRHVKAPFPLRHRPHLEWESAAFSGLYSMIVTD